MVKECQPLKIQEFSMVTIHNVIKFRHDRFTLFKG